MNNEVPANIKQIEMGVDIIKADGTVIHLGIVDKYHKNPIKRFLWKLKKKIWRIGQYG